MLHPAICGLNRASTDRRGWSEAVDRQSSIRRKLHRLLAVRGATFCKSVTVATGKAARVFAQFDYRTRKSWSRARRVVAKAEYLDKGENPRFVVTSLTPGQWAAQGLYENFYCARGEMENRIKEQMLLFADRLSTDEMKANQLRLYFSALDYTLVEALRRLGLKGTAWAEARVDTIRLRLFKIGALVHISVRRILLQMSSTYPWKDIYARAFHALRC
ncbi:MAG: transposase [Candidatus Binataceae bacterium]